MNAQFLESYIQKRFDALSVPLTVRQAFGYMLDANCGTLFVCVKGSCDDGTAYAFSLRNGEIDLESVRGEASVREVTQVGLTLSSRDYVFVKRALVARRFRPSPPTPDKKGGYAYTINNYHTGETHTSPPMYPTLKEALYRAEEKVTTLLLDQDNMEAMAKYQLSITITPSTP